MHARAEPHKEAVADTLATTGSEVAVLLDPIRATLAELKGLHDAPVDLPPLRTMRSVN